MSARRCERPQRGSEVSAHNGLLRKLHSHTSAGVRPRNAAAPNLKVDGVAANPGGVSQKICPWSRPICRLGNDVPRKLGHRVRAMWRSVMPDGTDLPDVQLLQHNTHAKVCPDLVTEVRWVVRIERVQFSNT